MKPIKILLDPEQSEILSDLKADCFIVIGKGSYPDNPNRWQLYIVPSSIKAVDAAVRVARGLSTERKPKATSTP